MLEIPQNQCPVVFENVKTLRPILLPKNGSTSVVVNLFKSTGYFEICMDKDEELPLATGKISAPKDIQSEYLNYPPISRTSQYKLKISRDDFYDVMHLRGFDYSGIFTGVQECDIDGKSATLKWNNNWVAFMDTMIQYIISVETRGHSLPTVFEKIVIDPEEHLQSVDYNSNLMLNYDKYLRAAKCGGIEIRSLTVTNVKRRSADTPATVRKYTFVPTNDTQKEVDAFEYSLDVASQIAVENTIEGASIKIAILQSHDALNLLKSMIERVNLKRTTFQELNSIYDNVDVYSDLLIVDNITNDNVIDCLRRARFVFGKLQNVDLHDIEIVYQHISKSETHVLLRRTQDLPDKYAVITANNSNCSWVNDLKLAVKKLKSLDSRIYLINEDFNSGIVGLFNTIRLEQFCSNLRLFLMRNYKNTERFSLRSKFYLQQLRKDAAVNIYQDGSWGTYRLLKLPQFQPNMFTDACLLRDTKGIKWVQKSPHSNRKEISVHYASIDNFDLMASSYKYGLDLEEELLGLEYSGIDKNGNNVMGVVSGGALATTVPAHPKLTWTFPEKLSFEEAATIPVAYTMSYYGLFVLTNPSPKDSVLIHNCRNDFSMAAISLLSTKGCKLYIVVNTDEKEAFRRINDANIIVHSENSPFYETLMKKTNGKGVNIIFNCASVDLIKTSKKCIAKGGRFVEINNNSTDLLVADDLMEKNCSVCNITIKDIFEESDDILDMMSKELCRLIKEGVVVPLKYTIYNKDDIDIALKQMEGKDRKRKCLIKMKENGRFFSKPENRILAYPRTYMNPEKCYIIVGGLGGFGFEFSRWLIERGATKIILNSRREVRSGYQALWIQKWNNQGITVVANTFDTTTLEGAECLINFASNLASIGGIFNTALHIVDKPMDELTPEDFNSVVNAKVFSVQNIDILSRKFCKQLDYFVVFSTIASSIGNVYQANYAFANSAVERICETRKAEGLPSVAIQWGPLADVGILVRTKSTLQLLETQRQKHSSCIEVVDRVLQLNDPVFASCVYPDQDSEVNEQKSLVESVASFFGIKNVDEVEDTKTLLEWGMDSLLGFEIKHLLLKECGVDVSVNDVRNLTFEKIKAMSK